MKNDTTKSCAYARQTIFRAATPVLLACGLLCLSGAVRANTWATNEAIAAATDEQLAAQAAARGDAPSAYYFAVKSSNDAYTAYYAYSFTPSSVSDYAAVFSAFAASSGASASAAAATGDYGTAQAEANAATYYAQAEATVCNYAFAVFSYNPTQEGFEAYSSAEYSQTSAYDSASSASDTVLGFSSAAVDWAIFATNGAGHAASPPGF